MSKTTVCVIVLIFLVGIFSSIHGDGIEELNNAQFSFLSQENETVSVSGCTNISANNYNENATDDDGSCDFDLDDDGVLDWEEIEGCTNTTANNFVANATDDDGSCNYLNYENGSFQHEYWHGHPHGALISQHEPSFVKFSPDGAYYATHHNGIIQIWDTSNASRTDSAHNTISNFSSYWVVDLDWAPSGDHIAIIVTYKLEEFGWPNTWTSWVIIYNIQSDEYNTLGTHYHTSYYGIEYSPDGSYLGVSLGNEIVVYDLLNGEKFLNYSSGDCYILCHTYEDLSWGNNPKIMTLAYYVFGYITIYDLDSQSITTQSSSYYGVESLKFSPDGSMIAVCTDEDDVALFNSENLAIIWERTTTLKNHFYYNGNSACNEISWAPDSTRFAIAYDGNGNHASSVLIYDANTSDIIDWLSIARPMDCSGWNCASIEGLDWSLDGEKIIFAADSKQQGIHTWKFNKNVEYIPGCTDETAVNYDINATKMDYSCRIFEEVNDDNYHQAYWDFCEWDSVVGEFICWMEDLNDLSDDEIEELQDCEQSQNGCETEIYCHEIRRTYATWECSYYDYEDYEEEEVSSSSSIRSKEMLNLSLLAIIAFIFIILSPIKKDSGVSEKVIEHKQDVFIEKENDDRTPPMSIEINLRELK